MAVDQNGLESLVNAVTALVPPKPLPEGWILKESRSQPGYHYYFNHLTGETSWQPPIGNIENHPEQDNGHVLTAVESQVKPSRKRSFDQNERIENPPKVLSSISVEPLPVGSSDEPKNRSHKRVKPDKVRVLHILKKHKGARRPSSWRVPTITISKEEAIDELKGLLELLHEVAGDPKELRATMAELARTESDCSSAKRGGDLGFFGPKKMQPAFEEASFQLNVGQLSDIVETSSGVHIILRLE